MRALAALVILFGMVAGCATAPEQAYYPDPREARTRVLAEALWRAARAASDDPHAYLKGIGRQCQQIHSALYQSYVAYPIESALPA